MFEKAKVWKAISKQWEEIDDRHQERVAALKATSAEFSEEAEALRVYQAEIENLNHEMRRLQSEPLILKAHLWGVPLPEGPEFWDLRVKFGGVLSVKGIHELRKTLRQERKERWEWSLTWVAALTGLIGATIGLISVL